MACSFQLTNQFLLPFTLMTHSGLVPIMTPVLSMCYRIFETGSEWPAQRARGRNPGFPSVTVNAIEGDVVLKYNSAEKINFSRVGLLRILTCMGWYTESLRWFPFLSRFLNFFPTQVLCYRTVIWLNQDHGLPLKQGAKECVWWQKPNLSAFRQNLMSVPTTNLCNKLVLSARSKHVWWANNTFWLFCLTSVTA